MLNHIGCMQTILGFSKSNVMENNGFKNYKHIRSRDLSFIPAIWMFLNRFISDEDSETAVVIVKFVYPTIFHPISHSIVLGMRECQIFLSLKGV